jgi:NADH-ubiquinone oxidoreductase chain 6
MFLIQPPIIGSLVNMNAILLDLLAFGTVISGILVITSRNPIISVLFLIAVFVNVACYLILLGINFIGVSYIVLYVGAIAILFLFVVMMLNIKLAHLTSSHSNQLMPIAVSIGFLFLIIVYRLNFIGNNLSVLHLFDSLNLFLLNLDYTGLAANFYHVPAGSVQIQRTQVYFGTPYSWDNVFIYFNQIDSIGNLLFSSHFIWILILGMILLLGMVGPIVLSLNPTKYDTDTNNQ